MSIYFALLNRFLCLCPSNRWGREALLGPGVSGCNSFEMTISSQVIIIAADFVTGCTFGIASVRAVFILFIYTRMCGLEQ